MKTTDVSNVHPMLGLNILRSSHKERNPSLNETKINVTQGQALISIIRDHIRKSQEVEPSVKT